MDDFFPTSPNNTCVSLDKVALSKQHFVKGVEMAEEQESGGFFQSTTFKVVAVGGAVILLGAAAYETYKRLSG